MDHTIQVGTNKALVILKVPEERMQIPGALKLKELDVLLIRVQTKSNGNIIADILDDLFSTYGYPRQIVIDGGPDLNKGVRLITENMENPFKVTYDITHLIAKLLKKKYGNSVIFKTIMKKISELKQKIQQTVLAYLIPPKERAKCRFQNLPLFSNWLERIINIISQPNKEEEKFESYFSWIWEYKNFIEAFCTEIKVITEFQKLVKNVGLTESLYEKANSMLMGINDPELRTPLQDYINTEFKYGKNQKCSPLLTSDPIESLFGKYKYIVKPHCMSEINSMILTLPCICEHISPDLMNLLFQLLCEIELDVQGEHRQNCQL